VLIAPARVEDRAGKDMRANLRTLLYENSADVSAGRGGALLQADGGGEARGTRADNDDVKVHRLAFGRFIEHSSSLFVRNGGRNSHIDGFLAKNAARRHAPRRLGNSSFDLGAPACCLAPMHELTRREAARALLRWYAEMGVDEAVGALPANAFAPEAAAAPAVRPAPVREPSTPVFAAPSTGLPADEAVREAERLATSCKSHEELCAAVGAFEGCGLRAGARSTVFCDGVPGARLLVIGEAPGRDEDRLGLPFVGRAGQLLDRMLAAIGRSRKNDTLISNVIYWRPPGNRAPTQIEIAICRPFVDRLIELTAPTAVLLAGSAPTQALLGLVGIMRARGIWREIETASGYRVAALPTLHPAFLLRSPAQKRLAWADLLSLDHRLRDR
jgi:DNA polymerase